MRIGMTIGGAGGGTLDGLIQEAQALEAQGYGLLGVPNIFGHDAIAVCTIVGRETSRIELSTAVVPTPPRHPSAIAQQALTAGAATGGRFTLGIGLSHKLVIEDMLGLSFAAPAKQMREYLSVLMPLLAGEATTFEGDLYRVRNTQLAVGDRKPVPVLVAALGPRMLEVAGTLADGTITWMTGPRTLAQHIVPGIGKAAAKAGRPTPRVAAGFPIAITHDADAARERANQMFQIYGQLPSYRAMLDREGAKGPGDVAIVGDESSVRKQLERLDDAGVTEFSAALFPADEKAIERTAAFLRSEL